MTLTAGIDVGSGAVKVSVMSVKDGEEKELGTYLERIRRRNVMDVVDESFESALRDADLRGVALRGASLRGAQLQRSCLAGADLRGAVLNATCLEDSEVLKVEGVVLRRLLEENPMVGFAIQRRISQIFFKRYVDAMERLQTVVQAMPLGNT